MDARSLGIPGPSSCNCTSSRSSLRSERSHSTASAVAPGLPRVAHQDWRRPCPGLRGSRSTGQLGVIDLELSSIAELRVGLRPAIRRGGARKACCAAPGRAKSSRSRMIEWILTTPVSMFCAQAAAFGESGRLRSRLAKPATPLRGLRTSCAMPSESSERLLSRCSRSTCSRSALRVVVSSTNHSASPRASSGTHRARSSHGSPPRAAGRRPSDQDPLGSELSQGTQPAWPANALGDFVCPSGFWGSSSSPSTRKTPIGSCPMIDSRSASAVCRAWLATARSSIDLRRSLLQLLVCALESRGGLLEQLELVLEFTLFPARDGKRLGAVAHQSSSSRSGALPQLLDSACHCRCFSAKLVERKSPGPRQRLLPSESSSVSGLRESCDSRRIALT